jgi:hypothetical protein
VFGRLLLEERQGVKNALQHWCRARIAVAYRTWHAAVDWAALRGLRQALIWFVCRQLAAAFNTWRAYLQVSRRAKRAGLHWCLSTLTRVFNTWWEQTHIEKAAGAKKVRLAALHWLLQSLSATFVSWRSVSVGAMQREKCLRHAAQKWVNKWLGMAFGTWVAWMRDNALMERCVRVAVLAWKQRELVRGYRGSVNAY